MRKIVGFGLGPLVIDDCDPSDGPDPSPSLTQYALLLSLRDLIGGTCGAGKICCYAQQHHDLSDAAIRTLEDAGITVLRDPHGFLEVDDETVVVSINPDVPVRQIVADIARPVALVWLPDTDTQHMTKGFSR